MLLAPGETDGAQRLHPNTVAGKTPAVYEDRMSIMLDDGKENEVVDIAINLVTRTGLPTWCCASRAAPCPWAEPARDTEPQERANKGVDIHWRFVYVIDRTFDLYQEW